jgi:hypothetical protein
MSFSAYSGWLTALLIPSLQIPDVLAGSWELLTRLGGTPKYAVWDRDPMKKEYERFFGSIGTMTATADAVQLSMIHQMRARLEKGFISGRTMDSPDQFNEQLTTWLWQDNRRSDDAGSEAPIGLTVVDRQKMVTLPARPPQAEWYLEVYVHGKPYIEFDSNVYAVDSAFVGRKVIVTADLSSVEMNCEGLPIIAYRRSCSHGAVIESPVAVRGRDSSG